MYGKFLIGSIIFAALCFGCGYRVCWLRLDKRVKKMETWNRRVERNYDFLLQKWKELARENEVLMGKQIAKAVKGDLNET